MLIHTWVRVKDAPKFQIELNQYEEKLYDIILHNNGISLSQIVKLTKMNKNTVEKYVKRLCRYDLIEFVELKQGEKSYFPRIRGAKTFAETHIQANNDFEYRRSLIRKCINSLENVPHQEAVHAYSNCIKIILAYDNVLKFAISTNRQKKLIKHWLELQEENQEILDEITTGISGTLYGMILLDLQKTEGGIVDKLELFMKKIKKL